jgi:hypothetical protein
MYTFRKILRQDHVKINTIRQVPWVSTYSLNANDEKRVKLAFLCIKYHLELIWILYKETDHIIWTHLR